MVHKFAHEKAKAKQKPCMVLELAKSLFLGIRKTND